MSVYSQAIEVLEEKGWHKGSLVDHRTGSVCIVGAVNIALWGSVYGVASSDGQYWYPLDARRQKRAEALETLSKALGVPESSGLATWNDDWRTTYEDVVLLLKRAHETTTE